MTTTGMACVKCGLEPFADRQEWARDKERQEIGRTFANPETALPIYCMTCGRYQGLRLQGEFARKWNNRIVELVEYFDAIASHRPPNA